MAIKWVSLEEEVEACAKQVKMAVYGFAGAGKTTLIGTLPGTGLLINAEGKLLSLRRVVRSRQVRGTVHVVNVRTYADLLEAFKDAKMGAESGQIEWVAIDSASEVAEIILAEEKKNQRDPRKSYGELADRMRAMFVAFRDLPCHVYMICKAELEQAEGQPAKVKPSFPGKQVGAALPYLMETLLCLRLVEDPTTKEVTRWLQSVATPTCEARDGSGMLDPMEPADLGAILAKVAGDAVDAVKADAAEAAHVDAMEPDADLPDVVDGAFLSK
jgi:hypothetical protein